MLSHDLAHLLPEIERRHLAAPEVYPAESIAALAGVGAFSAPFPEALGGRGSPLVEMVDAVTLIASACPGTALLACMPMGLAGALTGGVAVAPEAHQASAREQFERVAHDYQRGFIYAACNSEKGAGGSLAATKTIAKRGDSGFSLHGEKILASFGERADVFFSTAKVDPADLPGAGVVEYFFVDVRAPGVRVMNDWNGFGMRGTESHSVRYEGAPAREIVGFPDFIDVARPIPYWGCLFAAVPLGCARGALKAFGAPASLALRARASDALMRYESLRAYVREAASAWTPASTPVYAQKVIRAKTFVAQESAKICADLFALSGGRHYVRGGALSGALADSFAGAALRPPVPLALDALVDAYSADVID